MGEEINKKTICVFTIVILFTIAVSGHICYSLGYDDGICAENQENMIFINSIANSLTTTINRTVDTVYNESGVFTTPFVSKSEVVGRGPMAHYTFESFDGITSTMISYMHLQQYSFHRNLTVYYVINSLGEKVITGVEYDSPLS